MVSLYIMQECCAVIGKVHSGSFIEYQDHHPITALLSFGSTEYKYKIIKVFRDCLITCG